MPQSLTNFDAALKDNYGPGLKEAVNNSNPILTEAERNEDDIVGRKAVWSIHTGRSTSTGSRGELGTLPSADRQRYVQAEDTLTYHYHTIKVSGQAKHLTRNDEGAFARALESEIKGAEKDIKSDRARQCFNDDVTLNSTVYKGSLLGASTNYSSQVFTFANATAAEMRYVWVGMYVDVIDASSAAVNSASDPVVAVDRSAKTVTVTNGTSAATGDHLWRSGNLGKEINGLRYLISADDDDYAGVNTGTTEAWLSLTEGSSTTPVSEVIFETAQESVETDGDGSTPNLWIVEHSQRRKLASVLQAQKRYDGRETTLKAGWKGLQIAQGTLVADRFCPTTKAFGITTKELVRFVGLDWTWDEDDGKVLYKALDGSDAVEARYKVYDNLEVTNRNCHVVVTLAEPTF